MTTMTIRNAVPKFGIRRAVVLALAVVAAAVIAALLAVGSPASAQSSDDKEIWSATMTTGAFPIGQGYNTATLHGIGSLSDDEVPLEDDGDTLITGIIDSSAGSGTLIFGLDDRLNSLEEAVWTLHVDGRAFDFNDATYSSDSTYGDVYSWSLSPRFGWATSDTVALKITERKSISVLAGPDVEYGGNNNAVESTAKFTFSRTGNIDEALSFIVKHVEGDETWPRKFAAGQASFDNAHWAIDEDGSNNPVCTITWQLQAVSGYILAADTAVVTVEGPGTTCMATM